MTRKPRARHRWLPVGYPWCCPSLLPASRPAPSGRPHAWPRDHPSPRLFVRPPAIPCQLDPIAWQPRQVAALLSHRQLQLQQPAGQLLPRSFWLDPIACQRLLLLHLPFLRSPERPAWPVPWQPRQSAWLNPPATRPWPVEPDSLPVAQLSQHPAWLPRLLVSPVVSAPAWQLQRPAWQLQQVALLRVQVALQHQQVFPPSCHRLRPQLPAWRPLPTLSLPLPAPCRRQPSHCRLSP